MISTLRDWYAHFDTYDLSKYYLFDKATLSPIRMSEDCLICFAIFDLYVCINFYVPVCLASLGVCWVVERNHVLLYAVNLWMYQVNPLNYLLNPLLQLLKSGTSRSQPHAGALW